MNKDYVLLDSDKWCKQPLNIFQPEDYEHDLLKCPYRKYKSEEFKSCYMEYCMGFRKDNEKFWCAFIPDKDFGHCIELLNNYDTNRSDSGK